MKNTNAISPHLFSPDFIGDLKRMPAVTWMSTPKEKTDNPRKRNWSNANIAMNMPASMSKLPVTFKGELRYFVMVKGYRMKKLNSQNYSIPSIQSMAQLRDLQKIIINQPANSPTWHKVILLQ